MKRNNKNNSSFNIKTVGDLKELLKSYNDDVKLNVAHIKMLKPSMWEITVSFSGVKLYAETVEEAEEEATRLIENSDIFPQSSFEINDIDQQEPDED